MTEKQDWSRYLILYDHSLWQFDEDIIHICFHSMNVQNYPFIKSFSFERLAKTIVSVQVEIFVACPNKY